MSAALVLGVTGPVGAGKSTVASLLAASGVPVLDADAIAREITAPGSAALIDLTGAFGRHILKKDGSLDRVALAGYVFASAEDRRMLERITHPRILKEIVRRLALLRDEGEPLIPAAARLLAIVDAPLLFESSCDKLCDTTVAVLCAEEERVRRVMQRDGRTREQTIAIVRSQPPDDYYIEHAAHILRSDGGMDALARDTAALLDQIKGETDEAPC